MSEKLLLKALEEINIVAVKEIPSTVKIHFIRKIINETFRKIKEIHIRDFL